MLLWWVTETHNNCLFEVFETWNIILVLVTHLVSAPPTLVLASSIHLPDPLACCQNIKQSKSNKSRLNGAQRRSQQSSQLRENIFTYVGAGRLLRVVRIRDPGLLRMRFIQYSSLKMHRDYHARVRHHCIGYAFHYVQSAISHPSIEDPRLSIWKRKILICNLHFMYNLEPNKLS